MSNTEKTHSIHKIFFELLFVIDQKMKDSVQEEDSGLSMPELSVLRTLVTEGEMSLIEVAQKTGKDKSQITRVVQNLVRKKILSKERSEIDRRSFNLKLNKGVKEKISFYLKKEQELVDKMLNGTSKKEQRSLNELLFKMHDNLK